MTILYLYSELGPYNVPVIRCLVERFAARVHIVSWDKNRLKPFVPPPIEHVTYYKRSELSSRQIAELAEAIRPDIVYISGWMDKGYFNTARRLKAAGVPVVTGLDDQWRGSMRQYVGTVMFRLYYSRLFSHAWVAGSRQFEFARRLGFPNRRIIFDMLTADVALFAGAKRAVEGEAIYPKSFLYVGNFRPVKGTDILVDAFKQYRHQLGGKWDLVCVGNGELREGLRADPAIRVHEFMSQPELVDLCGRAGAFVLPSRLDQWGVVVHEFAAAGLPLLLSENVGAKTHFMIEGFNGFAYADNSVEALAAVMLKLSSLPDAQLRQMGENSRGLASRITPEISAANFVSILSSKAR